MPPGRAPVQRQLFCRSPWWRWAGCGSTRGACGTARFPHGGRVGHGCAGSALAREADGRQDVGGGRRGGGDERAGGAQGDEAEVLSTLLAERYERRSVMVTSNLVFSPWDRNVRAPSRLSPVRYVTVWSSRGVDERGAAGAFTGSGGRPASPGPGTAGRRTGDRGHSNGTTRCRRSWRCRTSTGSGGTRCRNPSPGPRPRSCSSRSAIWICRYWRLSSCPGRVKRHPELTPRRHRKLTPRRNGVCC